MRSEYAERLSWHRFINCDVQRTIERRIVVVVVGESVFERIP
jgi:hypothetical protein